MSRSHSKKFQDSIRYTLAYSAGNVALSMSCPNRMKENLSFLRDFARRGHSRDALCCAVENIFLGDDTHACRYAAVIRWYDRKHPGTAPLIVRCLDELADISGVSSIVSRIRNCLRVEPIHGKGKKSSNKLKKIVGK